MFLGKSFLFKFARVKFYFQSNRGYDPTFCVLEECGYMKQNAVASAMTYATNHGVSILLLCSTVDADHWLSKFGAIREEGDRPGVCLVQVKYLCDKCAANGETGMCVHGELKIPNHIETSSKIGEDPVRQAMDCVSPGAYLLEVCGSNLHTASADFRAFDLASVEKLEAKRIVVHALEISQIYVAMDPVQAGSGRSGIGLSVVGVQGQSFVVSMVVLACLH